MACARTYRTGHFLGLRLEKGDNFVKWDLMEKFQEGGYTLSVEILNVGLMFEAVEKKAQTK